MNVLQLLNEAADLSSGEKILKAFEKGMIPGVKKKVFFRVPESGTGKQYTQKTFINSLENLAQTVKEADFGNNYNAAIFLILKKLQNYLTMRLRVGGADFNNWLDSIKAYFNNRNKQEVKTEPITKSRFERFINSKIDFSADKNFEEWVNKRFASKATIKDIDKEITTVYPKDEEGWEVLIPRTFAAAKKLACMANRKAHWCTSASAHMFKSYSTKDNPLYIIRNDKKDKMFQMDWGEGSYPNFKNEKDYPAKVSTVKRAGISDAALKSIKNSKGVSVYDIISDKEVEVKDTEKKEVVKDWSIQEITKKEFIKLVGKFSLQLTTSSKISFTVEQLMNQKEKVTPNKYFKITGPKKTYYHIKGTVMIPNRGTLENQTFEVKGSKLIAKKDFSLMKEKMPEKVKKIIFDFKRGQKSSQVEKKEEISTIGSKNKTMILSGGWPALSKYVQSNKEIIALKKQFPKSTPIIVKKGHGGSKIILMKSSSEMEMATVPFNLRISSLLQFLTTLPQEVKNKVEPMIKNIFTFEEIEDFKANGIKIKTKGENTEIAIFSEGIPEKVIQQLKEKGYQKIAGYTGYYSKLLKISHKRKTFNRMNTIATNQETKQFAPNEAKIYRKYINLMTGGRY